MFFISMLLLIRWGSVSFSAVGFLYALALVAKPSYAVSRGLYCENFFRTSQYDQDICMAMLRLYGELHTKPNPGIDYKLRRNARNKFSTP